MKKTTFNSGLMTGTFFRSVIALFFFSIMGLFPFGKSAIAQGVIHRDKPSIGFDEKQAREIMKKDGVPDALIDKWIAKRKLMYLNSQFQQTSNSKLNNPPVVNAACGDMGGENGWGAWKASTGDYSGGNVAFNATNQTPTGPRFNLTSGTGKDVCTPGPNAGDPLLPVVCPGFGNASVQLGEIQTNGSSGGCNFGCVEQLTYPLFVTAQDTNFVYAYAMVIEDPGHPAADQPFVSFCIRDQAGNQVPCGCFTYVAGNLPGFYKSSCNINSVSYYKPWTLVGVNLSAYVNQTVNIIITNSDCGQGGHFAQSYFDFMCGTAALSAGCVGNQSTICGPTDPQIAYSYQWYQNGNLIPAPQGTQQCITVTPQPGDTVTVEVKQPSGCNFHLGYVPASIQPGFSLTGHCGTYTFTDTTKTSPASVSITSWNWNFQGGTPSSSTTQTPTVNYNSPGTYTVGLTITCSAGCTATVTHTITVTALPNAQFTPTPACLGNAVTFTDGSISPNGDPITAWNWTMPGAMPATGTGTVVSTVYSTGGSHIATLSVTTAQGCTNSISIPVKVYNPPVANFSGTVSGCLPVCNQYLDLSSSADGNIVDWVWSFPGGLPSSSVVQNPSNVCYYTAGTYGASLIVTTSFGCKDTIAKTPLVNVYSWPNADFCIDHTQAPATDPVFTFCPLWAPNPGVTNWVWDFGDGSALDSVSTNPVHSYTLTSVNNDFSSYTIKLLVKNQYGCWDTISKVVELIPEFEFYIPNCFTPNQDGTNEFFFGKGRGIKNYNIWLFDRWGNMVWDCHYSGKNTAWDGYGHEGMPSACKWDGKVASGGMDLSGGSGQLAQEDVYVWKVQLTDVFDKKHTYVGHVSIVK